MLKNIVSNLFGSRKQTLTIRVKLDERFSDPNLKIRYTLVDTLEERGIGEVYNEGMGEDFMEVTLDVIRSVEKEEEIKSVLQSLGLLANSEFIYSEMEE